MILSIQTNGFFIILLFVVINTYASGGYDSGSPVGKT